MKSILFGLAMLCALPGCCGWWKCKKDKCEKKACKVSGSSTTKVIYDEDMDNMDRGMDKGKMVKKTTYKK